MDGRIDRGGGDVAGWEVERLWALWGLRMLGMVPADANCLYPTRAYGLSYLLD